MKLTSKQITERLVKIPLTGQPRSAQEIARAINVGRNTITQIEHRALRKIRPLLRKLGPTFYNEIRDLQRVRQFGRPTPPRGYVDEFNRNGDGPVVQ